MKAVLISLALIFGLVVIDPASAGTDICGDLVAIGEYRNTAECRADTIAELEAQVADLTAERDLLKRALAQSNTQSTVFQRRRLPALDLPRNENVIVLGGTQEERSMVREYAEWAYDLLSREINAGIVPEVMRITIDRDAQCGGGGFCAGDQGIIIDDWGMGVFHAISPGPLDRLATFAHEHMHAYWGVRWSAYSPWVTEGLAVYVENKTWKWGLHSDAVAGQVGRIGGMWRGADCWPRLPLHCASEVYYGYRYELSSQLLGLSESPYNIHAGCPVTPAAFDAAYLSDPQWHPYMTPEERSLIPRWGSLRDCAYPMGALFWDRLEAETYLMCQGASFGDGELWVRMGLAQLKENLEAGGTRIGLQEIVDAFYYVPQETWERLYGGELEGVRYPLDVSDVYWNSPALCPDEVQEREDMTAQLDLELVDAGMTAVTFPDAQGQPYYGHSWSPARNMYVLVAPAYQASGFDYTDRANWNFRVESYESGEAQTEYFGSAVEAMAFVVHQLEMARDDGCLLTC